MFRVVWLVVVVRIMFSVRNYRAWFGIGSEFVSFGRGNHSAYCCTTLVMGRPCTSDRTASTTAATSASTASMD